MPCKRGFTAWCNYLALKKDAYQRYGSVDYNELLHVMKLSFPEFD